MFVFDFETKPIESRPKFPPVPVGVAVLNSDVLKRYLAWGHPTNNNVDSKERGIEILRRNWRKPLLCHNAAFDLAVAHELFDLPLPKGHQIHDTMILAFLLDPYGELALKPLAHQHLGLPPTEQDAVRDWLYTSKTISKNIKAWGAYIGSAPGDLVGRYAIGDVERTRQLYDHLHPQVVACGMADAYNREREIMPMLLDNSKRGIPLDRRRLARDTTNCERLLLEVDKEIRMNWPKEVGWPAPENLDSPDEVAHALSKNKRLSLPKTPTGKLSTAKDALMGALPDWRIKGLLLYRSALEKTLSTYMRPWLEHGELLHCNWNQVRNFEDSGAKTGRLSSSPNMQNITNPETYDDLIKLMERCRIPALHRFQLPNLRSYLVAPEGYTLFSRDYSQQELRFLAHYEDGALAQAYRDEPTLDVHKFVGELIHTTSGIRLERKPVKTINFGKVYGMGATTLSARLGIEYSAAMALIEAYDIALPSVRNLQRDCNALGRGGEYITTIGGRRYYAPPATRKPDGSVQTYEYRLLNYLIQGSSADQTKEAMRLWWHEIEGTDTRFLLTVHDQLVGCAPKGKVLKASKALDVVMREAFTLDVPVTTDPTYGENFGEMRKDL